MTRPPQYNPGYNPVSSYTSYRGTSYAPTAESTMASHGGMLPDVELPDALKVPGQIASGLYAGAKGFASAPREIAGALRDGGGNAGAGAPWRTDWNTLQERERTAFKQARARDAYRSALKEHGREESPFADQVAASRGALTGALPAYERPEAAPPDFSATTPDFPVGPAPYETNPSMLGSTSFYATDAGAAKQRQEEEARKSALAKSAARSLEDWKRGPAPGMAEVNNVAKGALIAHDWRQRGIRPQTPSEIDWARGEYFNRKRELDHGGVLSTHPAVAAMEAQREARQNRAFGILDQAQKDAYDARHNSKEAIASRKLGEDVYQTARGMQLARWKGGPIQTQRDRDNQAMLDAERARQEGATDLQRWRNWGARDVAQIQQEGETNRMNAQIAANAAARADAAEQAELARKHAAEQARLGWKRGEQSAENAWRRGEKSRQEELAWQADQRILETMANADPTKTYTAPIGAPSIKGYNYNRELGRWEDPSGKPYPTEDQNRLNLISSGQKAILGLFGTGIGPDGRLTAVPNPQALNAFLDTKNNVVIVDTDENGTMIPSSIRVAKRDSTEGRTAMRAQRTGNSLRGVALEKYSGNDYGLFMEFANQVKNAKQA